MVNLRSFKPDPSWIANQLRPKISRQEAEEAWTRLKESNMVVQEEDGKWKQSDAFLTSGLYAMSYPLLRYHEAVLRQSIEALWKIPGNEREIASITLSIKEDEYAKFIRKLIEIRRDLMATYDAPTGTGDKIIQFNLQVYPISE
jgi:uncharacterized protein (TIGR02147 family)